MLRGSPGGFYHPTLSSAVDRGGRVHTLVQAAAGPVLQSMAAEQLITLEEIKKHTNEEDCWLVINGAQLRLTHSVSPTHCPAVTARS